MSGEKYLDNETFFQSNRKDVFLLWKACMKSNNSCFPNNEDVNVFTKEDDYIVFI
jgi:hypothetical protein